MFQFLWPHEFKDTYRLDHETGLFRLSPLFISSMQDLRCWTMNSDFLQKYPDFQGDTPITNPRPAMLTLKDAEPQWYYFQAREDAGVNQYDWWNMQYSNQRTIPGLT